MSDTSLNPSLGNLSLESFVVMKDILKESSTPNSSGGIFKMSCALCQTCGDPSKFFGRFCSVECAKTNKMFQNCSQYRKSSNGVITEVLNSSLRKRKRQSNGTSCGDHKSNNASGTEGPVSLLKIPERHLSHNSLTQESSVLAEKQSKQITGPNEKQELRRNGVTCGKKASNSALCSKECKASNVRHIELVEGTRKCVICNLQCTCHLPNDKVIMSDKESDQQRPSPINRKRQVDRSDSDDENSDERCTTSKADAFYKEKLRKRKQLPAKCRLRNYSAGTREIHDKYSQWTPDNLPARNELSDTCKPAKNTIENESATLEIQIRNIRSVHDQNSDSSPHRTPPQEIEVNKPFLIDPKFLDDGENSCDNKVANSCAQCAARDNFMQNGLDRSDSSEPESRPTSRSSHRTDHLQQDATFLGRSPTIEDDFKRSFFFPQNSEIYRLHCEEIKSRIAVNQAKLMLFESELEKSKLERKLLLNKN